jgi:four helix bundle protein
MQDFKKLKVWEKSHQFTLEIYKITKDFPKEELYGLVSQIRRASSSIALNIAEATGRMSNAENQRFFVIATGSVQECSYCLILVKDLGYISENQYLELNDMLEHIKAMLLKMITILKERINSEKENIK